MIAAELFTISILLASLWLSIKHYDKLEKWMNNIIK